MSHYCATCITHHEGDCSHDLPKVCGGACLRPALDAELAKASDDVALLSGALTEAKAALRRTTADLSEAHDIICIECSRRGGQCTVAETISAANRVLNPLEVT